MLLSGACNYSACYYPGILLNLAKTEAVRNFCNKISNEQTVKILLVFDLEILPVFDLEILLAFDPEVGLMFILFPLNKDSYLQQT